MSKTPSLAPTRWILHLHDHLPLARLGRDPEGVHQLRVAAGRLLAWLRLSRTRVLQDDLRRLREVASPVRDLDVLLLRQPPADWNAWLRARRRERRERLVAALDSTRVGALLEALLRLPPPSRRQAKRGLEDELRRVRRRGRAAAREPGSLEAVHRLRRGIRRLRYASGWLGRTPKVLRGLQEVLGELNDRAVALRLLDAWEESGSAGLDTAAGLREVLSAEQDERHRRSLIVWNEVESRLERCG